ncbi:MAG: AAA family ATPase [Dolichospermum sp.]
MRLKSVNIQGYRPFKNFEAQLQPLEIIVGANGSGKSSFFEFLKFLRDSLYHDIPPEIVSGSIGQQIFHNPGLAKFQWEIEFDSDLPNGLKYSGEIMGPIGRTQVAFERVESSNLSEGQEKDHFIYMETIGGINKFLMGKKPIKRLGEFSQKRNNQLMLSTMINSTIEPLYNLCEYILNWEFYSSFNIANHKIRKSVVIEQEPILHEDAGNLSSVLHYLMTEHRTAFDELQQHLRSVIPGFKGLTVKARGGPGEVIAFWQESGIDQELSLADLSDGILRLICWICLCVQPNPPSLICIDEPDQGVHPRTLPVLAALFEKASERTQILLATHSSYFLTQFDISRIAVIRKENGEAKFIKPGNSQVLIDMLNDFGADEIEQLHRSDELERLP